MSRKFLCAAGILACLLTMIGLALAATAAEDPVITPSCISVPSRADVIQAEKAAYQAMKSCLAYIKNESWTGYLEHPRITAWDLAEILDATLTHCELIEHSHADCVADLAPVLSVLSHDYNGASSPPGYDAHSLPPFGKGSAEFYDDNAWDGIELVEMFNLEKQPWMLHRAEQVEQLEEFGAGKTRHFVHPGGIPWTQKAGNHYRPAVSAAAAAQLSLELYAITGEAAYLRFAERLYDWVRDQLLGNNGIYNDGMQPNGAVVRLQYSYNTGLMIGNGVLLYLVTSQKKYLRQAENTAQASLDVYGEGNRFGRQPPYFNAIYLGELLLLNDVAPDAAYRALLQSYTREVRANLDPGKAILNLDGDDRVLSQTAAVRVLAYAAIPAQTTSLLLPPAYSCRTHSGNKPCSKFKQQPRFKP